MGAVVKVGMRTSAVDHGRIVNFTIGEGDPRVGSDVKRDDIRPSLVAVAPRLEAPVFVIVAHELVHERLRDPHAVLQQVVAHFLLLTTLRSSNQPLPQLAALLGGGIRASATVAATTAGHLRGRAPVGTSAGAATGGNAADAIITTPTITTPTLLLLLRLRQPFDRVVRFAHQLCVGLTAVLRQLEHVLEAHHRRRAASGGLEAPPAKRVRFGTLLAADSKTELRQRQRWCELVEAEEKARDVC